MGDWRRSQSDRVGQMAKRESFCGHRRWNQFQTTASASRGFSQGRTIATTSANDEYLRLCVRKNKTANPSHLTASLVGDIERLEPMSNIRHEGGLYARRPVICAPRTSRQRGCLRWHVNISTGLG